MIGTVGTTVVTARCTAPRWCLTPQRSHTLEDRYRPRESTTPQTASPMSFDSVASRRLRTPSPPLRRLLVQAHNWCLRTRQPLSPSITAMKVGAAGAHEHHRVLNIPERQVLVRTEGGHPQWHHHILWFRIDALQTVRLRCWNNGVPLWPPKYAPKVKQVPLPGGHVNHKGDP